jgi:hypothetical protein
MFQRVRYLKQETKFRVLAAGIRSDLLSLEIIAFYLNVSVEMSCLSSRITSFRRAFWYFTFTEVN